MKKITCHYRFCYSRWLTAFTKHLKSSTSLFLVIFLLIAENIFAQAGTAPVLKPIGEMKLDGYLQRQSGVGDWLKGAGDLNGNGTYLFNDNGSIASFYSGAEYAGLIFHKIDRQNDQADEGFDGGNKLFHDPNTWGWSRKKQLSKDDMNHSMVFITRDAFDNIWVLISGDRKSENGTSYLDFEFYKNEVVMTAPNGADPQDPNTSKGGFLSSGEQGGRTIGDLSVTLSFTSGGTVAGVSFLTWAPANCDGCYDYVPLIPDEGEAYVAANSVIVNVPYEAFGLTSYAPNLFIEAAINVTALIGDGISDQCAGLNFKSLFIKTKSSAERTADLKDFIAPFSISLCGDRTAPSITPAGNSLSLGCNPTNNQIDLALGSATASDNCGTPTMTPSDGPIVTTSACGRSKTRTWSAVDGCGNVTTVSRTATWTADLTGPTITTGGSNAPLDCNPSASAINAALGTATATDGCGAVTISVSDGSVSSNSCSRSQTRTWTARDACGNTTTNSRTANWTAAGPLSITCPADVQLQCSDANISSTVQGVAVANGGCNPTVRASDQTTDRSCAKLIRRTWTATDACGQTATCVQNIYIADNTPPSINCTGTVSASDNCTAPGNILLFQSNGIWTAIDASGNISTANCAGARSAPTTDVQQEVTPVTEEEQTSGNRQAKQIPVILNKLDVYAYPNPYNDEVNFRFISPESGIGKVELYDMSGRLVRTINLGSVQAGVQRSVNYKVSSLSKFSMIYKLTVGDHTGSGTIVAGSKEP